MAVSAASEEEAQLSQTIEMFEVITQSQPLDYQSLEILKDAYFKLGRQKEAVQTSRRIAESYLQLGQLSSAILEYESILQRFPNDPEVQAALIKIESQASNLTPPKSDFELDEKPVLPSLAPVLHSPKKLGAEQIDDGRQTMQKLFVEGKFLSLADFNSCWPAVDLLEAPKRTVEPFIHVIGERGLVPQESSIKLLLEKSRLCFLPMERYDLDMDLARSFPREICQRWCILPFDRMSKSVLIATANPFNKQVGHDLESFTRSRVLWYMAAPGELLNLLRKVFR